MVSWIKLKIIGFCYSYFFESVTPKYTEIELKILGNGTEILISFLYILGY